MVEWWWVLVFLVWAHHDLVGGHIERIKREFGPKLAIIVAEVTVLLVSLALRDIDHSHAAVGKLDVGLVLFKVSADGLPDFLVLDSLNSDDLDHISQYFVDLTNRRVLDEVVDNFRVYHNYLYKEIYP